MKTESQLLPGFLISAGIHALVFTTGGSFFIKPAQFSVDPGLGGVEVQLLAAPQEHEMSVQVQSESVEDSTEIVKPLPEPLPKTAPKEKSTDKGKDEETLSSVGGALTESQPDYLSNPAPVYPIESRRMRQEGLVILSVDVDCSGSIVRIQIKQSTGYPSLDHAAIKAVRRWKIAPARIGQFNVDSRIDIPIRFRLEKN